MHTLARFSSLVSLNLLLQSSISPPSPRGVLYALATPKQAPSTFAELCMPELAETLAAGGIVLPMEAQLLAWDSLLGRRDAVIIAEAGSGKTLAYLLPLVEAMLREHRVGSSRAGSLHVVVPTRDLESQVVRVASELCALTPLSIATAEDPEAASAADIIVGTAAASAKMICGTQGGVAKRGKKARPPAGNRRRDPRTIVFDECDFMLAGARRTGSSAGASPAACILDYVRRSSKVVGKGKVVGNGRGVGKGKAKWQAPSKGSGKTAPSGLGTQAARTANADGGDGDGISDSHGNGVCDGEPAARPAVEPVQVVFVSATVPGQNPNSIGAFISARFPSIRYGAAASTCPPDSSRVGMTWPPTRHA